MLENLSTEKQNSKTLNIDTLSIIDSLKLMNEEDQKVSKAVALEIDSIAKAVELVVSSFKKKGRLIYFGAGTSGRLGVLDAAECPPTFGVDASQVVAIIAGGEKALLKAVENAEDSLELAKEELASIGLNKNDTVIGIAASGRTPYVIGGLKYANEVKANVISLACNKNAEISKYSHIAIEVDAGAEVLTGSTRLKAGTAQKNILNMISTASMIASGKVYKNLMVDLQPTNLKLIDRSKRIIMEATGVSYEDAEKYYELASSKVKVAIVMILTNSSYEEAIKKLENANGFISKTVS